MVTGEKLIHFFFNSKVLYLIEKKSTISLSKCILTTLVAESIFRHKTAMCHHKIKVLHKSLLLNKPPVSNAAWADISKKENIR